MKEQGFTLVLYKYYYITTLVCHVQWANIFRCNITLNTICKPFVE